MVTAGVGRGEHHSSAAAAAAKAVPLPMQLLGMQPRPLLRSRCGPGGPVLRALRWARRAQRGMRRGRLLPAGPACAACRGRALLQVRPSSCSCFAVTAWGLIEAAKQMMAQSLLCDTQQTTSL